MNGTDEREAGAAVGVSQLQAVVSFHLDWYAARDEPTEEGEYLLYNKCDGFHVAEYLRYEDGESGGFIFFPGVPVARDFYTAWAKMPNTAILFEHFCEFSTVEANTSISRPCKV